MSSFPSHGPPAIFLFFFCTIFVVVVGTILVKLAQGVGEWADNNAQPVRTDGATVVSKRLEVSGGKGASTTYFATFEFADGQRREWNLSGDEYGQIAEGDAGQVTHQGTRFLGFTRQPRPMEAEPEPAIIRPDVLACVYCGNVIPAPKVKCDGCGWTWRPVAEMRSGAEFRG